MLAVVFFKTRPPIEPVSFVHTICRDTANGAELTRCRFIKRLTPITSIEKATQKGLEVVASRVIAPHFHEPGQEGKKVSLLLFAFCVAGMTEDACEYPRC